LTRFRRESIFQQSAQVLDPVVLIADR